MVRTMNLKEACQRHGLNYRRAWYALATGKVVATVVGRTWSLTASQIRSLKKVLGNRPATTS